MLKVSGFKEVNTKDRFDNRIIIEARK